MSDGAAYKKKTGAELDAYSFKRMYGTRIPVAKVTEADAKEGCSLWIKNITGNKNLKRVILASMIAPRLGVNYRSRNYTVGTYDNPVVVKKKPSKYENAQNEVYSMFCAINDPEEIKACKCIADRHLALLEENLKDDKQYKRMDIIRPVFKATVDEETGTLRAAVAISFDATDMEHKEFVDGEEVVVSNVRKYTLARRKDGSVRYGTNDLGEKVPLLKCPPEDASWRDINPETPMVISFRQATYKMGTYNVDGDSQGMCTAKNYAFEIQIIDQPKQGSTFMLAPDSDEEDEEAGATDRKEPSYAPAPLPTESGTAGAKADPGQTSFVEDASSEKVDEEDGHGTESDGDDDNDGSLEEFNDGSVEDAGSENGTSVASDDGSADEGSVEGNGSEEEVVAAPPTPPPAPVTTSRKRKGERTEKAKKRRRKA